MRWQRQGCYHLNDSATARLDIERAQKHKRLRLHLATGAWTRTSALGVAAGM